MVRCECGAMSSYTHKHELDKRHRTPSPRVADSIQQVEHPVTEMVTGLVRRAKGQEGRRRGPGKECGESVRRACSVGTFDRIVRLLLLSV